MPTTAPPCSSTCSATSSGSATACRRCSSSKICTGPITRPAISSCSSPATCTTRGSCVVGTFRTDDLHRRHPLRPVLAELDRSGAAHRLELERFDRDEIARADRRHPRRVAPSPISSTGRSSAPTATRSSPRSCSRPRRCATTPLPDSLRDIVLARVDALPDAAQRVLRGRRGRSAAPPTHRLLSAVARDPRRRPHSRVCAMPSTHQVLVTEPDALAYRFRHALVLRGRVRRPAAERARPAARRASPSCSASGPDWFDGDEQSLASELACHWYAAHDQRRALPAALAAARRPRRCTPSPRRSRTPNGR